MKKLFFSLVLLVFITNFIRAQFSVGVKAGISSSDLKYENISAFNHIVPTAKDAHYGIQAGIWAKIGILGFNLQPEILFNSNTASFEFADIGEQSTTSDVINAKYHNIDIPVLLMFSPGFLKIYGGPVGHYFLNDFSIFQNKTQINQEFKKFTYGYQFGAGITIKRFTFDVRYEGRISEQLAILTYKDQEFILDNSPSRLLFSIWFRL